MKDYEYTTYYDGVYTQVHTVEDCVRALLCRNEDKNDTIERLQNRVKELEDEHYKDKRIQEMSEQLKEMRAALVRGFSIEAEEAEAISAWKDKHDTVVHNNPRHYHGTIGGGYTYRFYPSSIGTVTECYCSGCHRKAFAEAGGDLDKYVALMRTWNASISFDDF